MPTPPLAQGATQYGAQLGRRNIIPNNCHPAICKLYLQKLRMNGPYDEMGAYWGLPQNLYMAFNLEEEGDEVQVYVRATTHEEAKQAVLKVIPTATFYR